MSNLVTPDTLTLTCTWGRAPLPATTSPQAAYLLVEALAEGAAQTVPLNFCLVLDRSGSMQGPKLAAMKVAGDPNNPLRMLDSASKEELKAEIMKHLGVLAPVLGIQLVLAEPQGLAAAED